MNNKKAIQILLQQKGKVDTHGDIKYGSFLWIMTTLSYFEDFFGKSSQQYKLLESFDRPGVAFNTNKAGQQSREETINRLKVLMDESIIVIKNKGINQPPKENFIKYIPNVHLAWIMPLVIMALISIGYGWGTYTTGFKNYTLDKENEKLKDSIRILSTPAAKTNYKPDSTTNKASNNKKR